MTTELNPTGQEGKKVVVNNQGGSSGAVYGLGLIGAWVYYIGRASSSEDKVRGFFKGLVWPAFLVYEMLEFLNQHKELSE